VSSISMNPQGEIALPIELRERYGLNPDTPIRVIETRSGILLIPLTDAPMEEELAKEIAEWQSLSASTWDMFPFEDIAP
jgi:bifunctional DNA-binding transcriptional regulator/antitoxin component of YhaV-PrlF toxin-antitoxin module